MPHLEDRQLDRFVGLLLDNATLCVSGEKYAHDLGVTRQTISNWVHYLEQHGVRIEISPHAGYRLSHLPDLLLPNLIHRELHTRLIGRQLHHFFQIASTNESALQMGREGKADGSVILAEEQTAGRGRMGRSWLSEKGSGIYLSVLLYPPLPPWKAPLLSLLSAVAVQRTIQQVCQLEADIKWPNDLLLGGKKFAGILLEMSSDLDRIKHAVIGIGVNVNQKSFPSPLDGKATSLLLETKRLISRIELTARLLHSFDELYRALLAGKEADIITDWIRCSSFARGRRILLDWNGAKIGGITLGLTGEGFLRIQLDDGTVREIASGEILDWT
jgi:BirA family biotin operon repressor/biotin-[acetyl-CoA-carboxylase] ligase